MVNISVPKYSKSNEASTEILKLDAKAFIFDKDGTLLTHDHFVPIMDARIELLTDKYDLSDEDQDQLIRIFGLDPETKQIIPHGTMFIARSDTKLLVQTFLMEKGFRGSKVKFKVNQIFNDADEQVELEKYIKPFPKVPELLDGLKESGVKIAIATHDTTAAALKQLSVAGIDKYLDLIIGLDYSSEIIHKPSPTMLNTACREFNLDPKDTVVVGDSVNDVLMGIHGGAGLSVGVLTGEHQLSDFWEYEYDSIISSLSEFSILGDRR